MGFGEVDQRTDIKYSDFQSSSTVRYMSLTISLHMSIDYQTILVFMWLIPGHS